MPPGTTATVFADVATETVEPAATGIVVDGTTIGAVTVGTIGTEEATSGTSTAVLDDLETSTIVLVDNDADIFTSVKPGDGDVTEDDDTTVITEGTAGADSVSEQTATVEVVTVDTNATTIFDNETATDVTTDVTTISVTDNETGNDTLWTTTIGIDYIIQI